jgi:RNA polymerase sigma-70 factor (ECF subfamily)
MEPMREAELEQLYARLERPLYNVVFRSVWHPEEAQDIVQEAFVRLWRMRDRVKQKTAEPLVYKIALNIASSRRRSRKLWRWVSLDALRSVPASQMNAEEALSAERRQARFRSALGSLPEDLRQVVMLCEFSELSYEEIAGVLSIPAGTVGSRRHRAITKLKAMLSEGGDDDAR